MSGEIRFVEGVGINDADYSIKPRYGPPCRLYITWANMLRRCYSLAYQLTHPSYKGCSVCDEWLLFSNFKAWMEQQDWQDKALDKDLLVPGNKVYSPENCIFVSRQVNSFLAKSKASRGEHPIGAVEKRTGRFIARCKSLGRGDEYLGTFDTAEAAHRAWLNRKRELAIELASLQTDIRVVEALKSMPYEDF